MNYRRRFLILLLAAAGLGLWFVLKHKHFPSPLQSYLLVAGFVICLWSFSLIAIFFEQQLEQNTSHDLIDCFREDAAFRFMLWRQGLVMLLGALIIEPYTKMSVRSAGVGALAGVVLLFTAWGIMVYQTNRRLTAAMPDEDAHLSAFARRLKNRLTYGALLSSPFVHVICSSHTENLISELAFFGVVAPMCGLAAFGIARFLPGFMHQLPDDAEFRQQLQLTLWVVSFLIFVTSACVINRRIPLSDAKSMRVLVDKKGGKWKKERGLFLHIQDKPRKFMPDWKEWKQLRELDSITVYVRTGALGFDFIEKFGE